MVACIYVILDDFHDDNLVVAVLLNLLLRRTASEDFGNHAVPIAICGALCCIAAILCLLRKYLNLRFHVGSPPFERVAILRVYWWCEGRTYTPIPSNGSEPYYRQRKGRDYRLKAILP